MAPYYMKNNSYHISLNGRNKQNKTFKVVQCKVLLFAFEYNKCVFFFLFIIRKLSTFLLLVIQGTLNRRKCRLTNEYRFFLFLIGCGYYEKYILFQKKQPILAGSHL